MNLHVATGMDEKVFAYVQGGEVSYDHISNPVSWPILTNGDSATPFAVQAVILPPVNPSL